MLWSSSVVQKHSPDMLADHMLIQTEVVPVDKNRLTYGDDLTNVKTATSTCTNWCNNKIHVTSQGVFKSQ